MYRGRHAPYPNPAQHNTQKRQQLQQQPLQQSMNNFGPGMYGPNQVRISLQVIEGIQANIPLLISPRVAIWE